MSATAVVQPIALTWGEWTVLEAAWACSPGPIRVSGPKLMQARSLVAKGLGSLGQAAVGWWMFEINADGRHQLEIRR